MFPQASLIFCKRQVEFAHCSTWACMDRQIFSHTATLRGTTLSVFCSLHILSQFILSGGWQWAISLSTCFVMNCNSSMLFFGTLWGSVSMMQFNTSATLSSTSSSTSAFGLATQIILADAKWPAVQQLKACLDWIGTSRRYGTANILDCGKASWMLQQPHLLQGQQSHTLWTCGHWAPAAMQ